MGARMITHTVSQGECLSSIALSYGFDWEYIYNHGANTEFKELRGDPNVIYPGDEIKIPDKEEGGEHRAIDDTHKFKVKGVPWRLAIVIRDIRHKPVKDLQWHFILDGEATPTKTTADDGKIEHEIPVLTRSAVLVVGDRKIPIHLHELDPANTVHGLQQRLKNLGYDVGIVDGYLGPRTRGAVMEFQSIESHRGLDVTGEPDPRTIQRLRVLHENVELGGKHNELDDSHSPDRSPPAASPTSSDVATEPDDDEPEDDWSIDEELALAGDPSRSMSVYALQGALIALGYTPGPHDGLMGPQTRSGVRDFQTVHDLLIDGIAGPQTWGQLRNIYNANI